MKVFEENGIVPVLVLLGALAGGLGVAAGAYASHRLGDEHAVELFRLAGQYQLFHALALIGVALLAERIPPGWPRLGLIIAGGAFALGIVLFCGALYAIALNGPGGFGAAAPFGGASLMFGWAALAAAALFWPGCRD
ncbi:MAG: DUF423 domain-containing protein [Azospirillum sp.]|nr:DUF423 domain-containing protein [Azospirillum sp.]